MIAVVGGRAGFEVMVVDGELGVELVGLALEESVEPVEPALQWPVVERAGVKEDRPEPRGPRAARGNAPGLVTRLGSGSPRFRGHLAHIAHWPSIRIDDRRAGFGEPVRKISPIFRQAVCSVIVR